MAKLKTGRHTSGLKAARQAERRALRNRAVKKKARAASKELLAAAATNKDEAKKSLSGVYSAWDRAARSGALHWKTVARRKSRAAHAVR